jgi:hypothetical protein
MSPYRSIQKSGKGHHSPKHIRLPRLGGSIVLLALGVLIGVAAGLGMGILVRSLHPPAPLVHVPPPSSTTDPKVWKQREKDAMEEIHKHIDSLTPGLGGDKLLSLDPNRPGVLAPSPTLRPMNAP